MKTLIKLAIVAAILHGTWRAGAVYLRHYEFKDEVQQISQFSDRRPIEDVRRRVLEAAKRHQIPLDPEALEVRREENHTYVNVAYVEQVEVLPTYFRPWPLEVKVDTFTYVAK